MNWTVQHLQAAIAAGENLSLVDVRTPAEFAAEHIDGSRLVPLDRLSGPALTELAAESATQVLVCATGRRAGLAAEKLAAAGGALPRVLAGGLNAWIQAGHPVVRGKGAISLERQVRITAGLLVLAGIALGSLVNPAFYALSGFVGAGLIFAGITDWCGMALLLARMPWNQSRQA
jgi:rhodanese-related sulfurtransferase